MTVKFTRNRSWEIALGFAWDKDYKELVFALVFWQIVINYKRHITVKSKYDE